MGVLSRPPNNLPKAYVKPSIHHGADRQTTLLELLLVAAAVVGRAGRLASHLLFVSGTFVVCIYSGAFVGRGWGCVAARTGADCHITRPEKINNRG